MMNDVEFPYLPLFICRVLLRITYALVAELNSPDYLHLLNPTVKTYD